MSAGWWVLIGITALFTLILAGPISLKMVFEQGDLTARVRYWGIPIYRIPVKSGKEEDESADGKDSSKRKKRRAKPKKKSLFAELAEGGMDEFIQVLKRLVAITATGARQLLAAVVVRKLEFALFVASEDAAETAMRYGQVCAVVYPAMSMLCGVMRVRCPRVGVVPDYLAETSAVRLKLKAHIITGRALWAVLCWLCSVAWVMVKVRGKKEQLTKNN